MAGAQERMGLLGWWITQILARRARWAQGALLKCTRFG